MDFRNTLIIMVDYKVEIVEINDLVQFPIQGDLREILLMIGYILVVLNIELGIVFFNKFIKEKNVKNYTYFAWTILFSGFSIASLFIIISDFYVVSKNSLLLRNIGYIFIGIAGLVFSFIIEREMKSDKYIYTILMECELFLLIFNIYFNFINPTIISLFFWIILFVLLISYSKKFLGKKHQRLKVNIYGFVIGAILTITGWVGETDLISSILGILFRLIGNILMIFGIILMALFFYDLPRLTEIDWIENVRKLYVIHYSGRCLYEYTFREEGPLESLLFSAYPQLLAGGLTGITQALETLIRSKQHLKVLDGGDVKIMFEHGKNVFNVLIVDKILEIIKIKLKNLTKMIETLYQDIWPSWDGDISKFGLLEKIIQINFEISRGKFE